MAGARSRMASRCRRTPSSSRPAACRCRRPGATARACAIARALGHTMHATYAALTPLTAHPAPFAALSGISLPVTLSARDEHRAAAAAGGFLFTHRGYSGPRCSTCRTSRSRSRRRATPTVRRHGCASGGRARTTRSGTTALEPQGARTVACRCRASPAGAACRRARRRARGSTPTHARQPQPRRSPAADRRRSCAARCRGRATRATRRPK